MVAYLWEKFAFVFNEIIFIFNGKYLKFKERYLCSINIFAFNEQYLYSTKKEIFKNIYLTLVRHIDIGCVNAL